MRYFSEAGAAAERIKEVIKRVPKIDSDNKDGQTLEKFYGEVEFDRVETRKCDFERAEPEGSSREESGVGGGEWLREINSDSFITEVL